MLPQKCPASLFEREAEVLFGALKTKSCLSEASSFCLAEKSAGVVQKVQTAVFLFCYLFSFCCQKEKSKALFLSITNILGKVFTIPQQRASCFLGD